MNILSRLVFAPIGQDSGAESDMDIDSVLNGVTRSVSGTGKIFMVFTSFLFFVTS